MKQIKRIFAIILIACVVMGLSGCRYSDTLEQIIYNQYKEGMIDIAAPFEYAENDLDNEQKSNDLKDLEQQEDATRSTMETALGIAQDTDEADTQDGYEVTYAESNGETNAESDSTEFSTDSDSPVQSSDSGGASHSDENSQSVGNSSASVTENTGKDGVTGLGGEDAVGDINADTDKQVVNPAGDQVQLPSNVETVAAVGELAAMFVILDCEEKLVATDAKTAEKAQTIPAFAGLSGAEAVWESDGTSGLSDNGFNRLMELKPDLILEISGSSTFSDTQIGKLKENGSAYLALEEMTDITKVENVLYNLGSMLGDEAEQRAEEYEDWAEHTYSDITKLTKGVNNYTLYIDGWDSDAKVLAKDNSSSAIYEVETGCAVINGWKYGPTQSVSSFLSYAGVTNASSLNRYTSSKERGYFVPMEMQSGIDSFDIKGGTLATFTYSRKYSWTMKSEDVPVSETLGAGTAYQYVLAADQATASAIEASKAKENGMWSVYTDLVQNEDGTFTFLGYKLGKIMMMSHIAQNGSYCVLTNPAGYAGWTQGGCESILETVWAAWRISGVIDEETVKTYITDFYQKFYDCDLSNNELEEILEGN